MTRERSRSRTATPTSRRDWLKLATGGAVTALAGCGAKPGSRNDSDDGPRRRANTATPPAQTDQVYVTTEFTDPKYSNYNPFDRLRYPEQSPWIIFGLPLYADQSEGRLIEYMAKPPELDRQTGVMTMEVNPDGAFTWHDGDPLSAKDFETKYRLKKIPGDSMWEEFEWVRAEDDTTLKIKLRNPDSNSQIIGDRLVTTIIDTKHSEYEQFLPPDGEQWEDLSARDQALLESDLMAHRVKIPTGWGPFEVVEKTERSVKLERHEGHPYADGLNFDRMEFRYFSTKQTKWQSIISGRFSGAHAVPTGTVERQIPDRYRNYSYDRRIGMALGFQYDHPYFDDDRIRRAFAYVLDKETIVGNSGLSQNFTRPAPFDTGWIETEDLQREYFGDALDEMVSYDQNAGRARTLLESAGWSKRGGTWRDADGDPVSLVIKVPIAFTDWVNMAQTAASQLSEFGLNVDFKTEELVVYYGESMARGEFDMAGIFIGGARANPYFAFDWIWNGLPVVIEQHNLPMRYEVPMPIGDPDGATETIDIRTELNTVARNPQDSRTVTRAYQRLAWTYNRMMPMYVLNGNIGAGYLDMDNWMGPHPDDVEFFYPLHQLMHYGRIKGRGS